MSIGDTRTSKEYTNRVNRDIVQQADGQKSTIQQSTCKNKKGLLYNILSKKQKKHSQHGSTRKRASKKQSQIRQHFEPATAHNSAEDTAEETEEVLIRVYSQIPYIN
eukprot:5316931-Ditylum_brightwellii.AAC.1